MKRVIFFVGTTVLIIAGFIYYEYNNQQPQRDLWSFVPEGALVVYESENIIEDISKIKNVDLMPNDLGVKYLGLLSSSFNEDSLSLNKLLRNTHALISLHNVKKEEVDLVYYFNLNNNNGISHIQDYINNCVEASQGTLTSRSYEDREIIEVEIADDRYAYFIEDDILIYTETPFLLEDVIRTIIGDENKSYKGNHSKAIAANKLKNDQGDLYINLSLAKSLFSVFALEELEIDLANSTFLDLKLDKYGMSLSGFTSTRDNNYIETVKEQSPVQIGITNYIPNSTYSVFHLGIDNQDLWLNSQRTMISSIDSISGWDMANINKWLGIEIALISMNKGVDSKLLLIDNTDINESLSQLNRLNEHTIINSQDSIFYESYGDILIKELTVNEFPEALFGSLYSGFPISYYAVIDEYLAIANSLETMHELINSIEQEETWGRTVEKTQWLSQTLQESNVSYFFDYSQAKSKVKSSLNRTWSDKLIEKEHLMNGLGMGAIQFSNIDGEYYTSIVLEYASERTKPVTLNFNTEFTTYLNSSIKTKPYVVKSHVSPAIREVMVQDSLQRVYLIDHKGGIVWQDSIQGSLVGGVHQLDYYKNKKLQYLFGSGSLINLLDRNGNAVEGYPLDVKVEIDQLAVFDYDNTKNYRILLSDKNGDLYMYDKEGDNLKGWQPRKINSPLVSPPRHIRVRGKDVILVVLANGEVNAMNRRGEMLKGFPIKSEKGISGDIHIDIGRDFKSSYIYLIDSEGELMQFDLFGDVVRKKQFSKSTKDTFFQLVDGVAEDNFVLSKQNAFRLSIVNKDEELVLEKDYLTKDVRSIQFYDLGGDDNIYVINDYVQGFGYIYDHTGKLMNNVPINNQHEIGLMSNTKSNTKIYTTYEDQVSVYSY